MATPLFTCAATNLLLLYIGAVPRFVDVDPRAPSKTCPKDDPLAWLSGIPMVKYQRLPNLSFLAMRRGTLDTCFPDGRITAFDRDLVEGKLPFRIVNTPAMSAENRIPIRMVQWLDTGCEPTTVVARHGLRHETLTYRGLVEQDVFASVEAFARLDFIRQPEFFYLGNEPFLCHFKKGSMKLQDGTAVTPLAHFVANVERYLARRMAADPAREAVTA